MNAVGRTVLNRKIVSATTVNVSKRYMGGGRRFHYPKWVWSPAGGWWANPENWKRNTALYGVFVGAFCLWGYSYATPMTTRYEPNKASQLAPLPESHGGHH